MLLKTCADLHIRQAPFRPIRPERPIQAPRGLKNAEPVIGPDLAATTPCIALKEWAALVAAIGDGKQTVLLRKGGLREGPFKAPASSFYLFPTSFHSEGSLLKPDAEEAYHKASPQQSSCMLFWLLGQVSMGLREGPHHTYD